MASPAPGEVPCRDGVVDLNELHWAILREVEGRQPPGAAFEPKLAWYSEEQVWAAVRELADMGMIEARNRRVQSDLRSTPTRWAAGRLLPKGRMALEDRHNPAAPGSSPCLKGSTTNQKGS